jgi:tetratricopeptide (TPR) repeat protein
MHQSLALPIGALLLFLVPLAQLQSVSPEQRKQADALYQAQDWKKARAAYEQIVQLEPKNAGAQNRLGACLHGLGEDARALEALGQSLALSPTASVMYNLACVHACLGHKDEALAWLEKCAQNGFAQGEQLRADKDLASLRKEPRFEAVAAAVERTEYPCRADPHCREFDYWIGEWDVLDTQGKRAGSSSVQLILGDCVLLENWTDAAGRHGKSFNIYDQTSARWHQTWVDDRGTFTEYKDGQYKDGVLVYLADQTQPDGKPGKLRMSFFKLPEGKVRQFGELSLDGGGAWTPQFDLTYVPKKP